MSHSVSSGTSSKGARRAPNGPLPHLDQVRVVFLKGSAQARGAQLGEYLAVELREDPRPVRFWVEFVRHVLRRHMPGAPAAAIDNVARAVQRQLVAPVASAYSPRLAAAVDAYADALGPLDLGPLASGSLRETVRLTHAMYDGLNVLTGLPIGMRAPAGQLGCSSLVALPSTTKSGTLVHGRNFDLPPHGEASAPLVCVHLPDEGIPHVSLHHGGGFTAGITATNQAGLSLGVHQNLTTVVSPHGRSVIDVALDVIEHCDSLSAALERLRSTPTAGGWTFVLSDARKGRAAAVEIDARGACSLFPPGHFLAVANCYRTRKARDSFSFTGALREHNWCRLSRLNQHARAAAGAHNVVTVAHALADHMDAYAPSRRRAYGNTVSAIHNLDAVIFAPELDGLWVAVGHGPRNSADGYVGLRLSTLFDERVEALAPVEVELPHDRSSDASDFRRALQLHSEACLALFTGDDPTLALDKLEEAARLDAGEPLHRFLRGVLLLQEGFAGDAVELLAPCIDEETSPYRKGLSALMLGRALDVLGHRTEARGHYRSVPELAGDVDPGLVARARKDHAAGFAPARAPQLIIDNILADVVN